MLSTKAIIAKNIYNGAVTFHIKTILPYIKQLTFEPKHGLSRMNRNVKYLSRFLLYKLTLELTLTRKCRSSRPFSYSWVQLKQQHYSAKKRHPIKHGLSSCIIGKFSFFLSYMHCRFHQARLLLCCWSFHLPCVPSSFFMWHHHHVVHQLVSRILHVISKSGTA